MLFSTKLSRVLSGNGPFAWKFQYFWYLTSSAPFLLWWKEKVSPVTFIQVTILNLFKWSISRNISSIRHKFKKSFFFGKIYFLNYKSSLCVLFYHELNELNPYSTPLLLLNVRISVLFVFPEIIVYSSIISLKIWIVEWWRENYWSFSAFYFFLK